MAYPENQNGQGGSGGSGHRFTLRVLGLAGCSSYRSRDPPSPGAPPDRLGVPIALPTSPSPGWSSGSVRPWCRSPVNEASEPEDLLARRPVLLPLHAAEAAAPQMGRQDSTAERFLQGFSGTRLCEGTRTRVLLILLQ